MVYINIIALKKIIIIGKNNLENICQAIKNKNIVMILESIFTMNLNLQEKVKLNEKNMTFLHYACIYGNTLILELLIQNGSSLTSTDDENLKPIDVALSLQRV